MDILSTIVGGFLGVCWAVTLLILMYGILGSPGKPKQGHRALRILACTIEVAATLLITLLVNMKSQSLGVGFGICSFLTALIVVLALNKSAQGSSPNGEPTLS